jgi:hypothetical protein
MIINPNNFSFAGTQYPNWWSTDGWQFPPITGAVTVASPIQWYPSYDAQVKASPPQAQFSAVAIRIPDPVIAPVTINSWYPSYDSAVTPPAKSAQYSRVDGIRPEPINIIQWASVTLDPRPQRLAPASAATQVFKDLLVRWTPIITDAKRKTDTAVGYFAAPIPSLAAAVTANNWYPDYAPDVVTPRRAPESLIAQKSATVTAAAAPIQWFPTYPQEVRAPMAYQGGGISYPFLPITPTTALDEWIITARRRGRR